MLIVFVIMINSTYEGFKARQILIFQYFSFYEQLKFHAQHEKNLKHRGLFFHSNTHKTSVLLKLVSRLMRTTTYIQIVTDYAMMCSFMCCVKMNFLSFKASVHFIFIFIWFLVACCITYNNKINLKLNWTQKCISFVFVLYEKTRN